MIRQQPRSTLFPSTTLFRSDRLGQESVDPRLLAFLHRLRGHVRRKHDDRDLNRLRVHEAVSPIIMLDRKSTRLNSSHLVISYAVFCLKKNINLRRRELATPT